MYHVDIIATAGWKYAIVDGALYVNSVQREDVTAPDGSPAPYRCHAVTRMSQQRATSGAARIILTSHYSTEPVDANDGDGVAVRSTSHRRPLSVIRTQLGRDVLLPCNSDNLQSAATQSEIR